MNRRKLGRQGLQVSAIGLGCMGMSEFYGTADEGEAVATIHRALDLGRRTTFGGSRSRFRRGSPRGIATPT